MDADPFSYWLNAHAQLLLAAGPPWPVALLSLILLLAMSAIISGSEVAFFSLKAPDYEQLEQESTPAGRRLLLLKNRPRYLLATILIANNFVNIAIVLLSELMLTSLLSESVFIGWATSLKTTIPWLFSWAEVDGLARGLSFSLTVIGVTFLLVLFGEVAPKVYARFNSMKLALFMSGPILFLTRLFDPLAAVLVKGSGFLERRFARSQSPSASREDIDEAIELTVNSDEETSTHDLDILKRIVKFSDVTARQIMRPRGDVVAVDQKVDYHELLRVARESGYSRIPVYDENFDELKGVLYIKDLLGHRRQPADFDWNALVRTELLFVPENKKINDLLREFQIEKMHMAIVVNEYGGTSGIVTLEDILEEVIGDIQDEFDDEPEVIYTRIDEQNFIFDGKTMLNDVYRITGLPTSSFEEVKGESESFAGMILEMLEEMPSIDQEIIYEGFRFKVVAVNDRRVEEILITLPADDE
ncbi:MAG: gliding motility-associated protein GldE [Saprospiraceae bacterium]